MTTPTPPPGSPMRIIRRSNALLLADKKALQREISLWIEAANTATKLINEQQQETLSLRALLRDAYEHLDTHDLGCPVGEGYGEPCRCELPTLRRRIEAALKDGDA